MNISYVILTLCLSYSVAGQSETSQQINCDIVQNCVGGASTGIDAELKAMKEKFSKFELRLNLTVDSLKSETDTRLRRIDEKYSKQQQRLKEQQISALQTNRTLKKMSEDHLQLNQQLSSTDLSLQSVEGKVEDLEENFSRMDQKLPLKMVQLVSLCPVMYDGKCFVAKLNIQPIFNFSTAAEKLCDNGWKLGDIYSKNHYNKVADYLRKNNFIHFVSVWIGMTYDPTTKKMYLSDGTQFTEKLPFIPDQQTVNIADFTKMNIVVTKDPSIHGMVYFPVTAARHGVLCEI